MCGKEESSTLSLSKSVKVMLLAGISGCFAVLGIFFVISTSNSTKIPVSVNSSVVASPVAATTAAFSPGTTAASSVTPRTTTAPAATTVVAPVTSQPIKTVLPVNPTAQPTPQIPGLQQTWLNGLPVTIYVPETARNRQSAQLLIALHGMSGQGGAICNGLISFAQQNGVILLAPTFNYSPNWQDPQTIAEEDVALSNTLNLMVSELEPMAHTHLKNRLMFYGFSRGAQLAHRYALLFPEKTLAVAVLSGGSYTLPYRSLDAKGQQPLPFPFGVSDLINYNAKPFNQASFTKVNFQVEVGEGDNDNSQVSRAWDSYIGKNRLERAQNFYQALRQMGLNAQFVAFPGASHQETLAMRESALKFFRDLLVA